MNLKLFSKYRLVLLNESTSAQQFSLRLTKLGVLTIIIIITLLIIGNLILLFQYPSIKNYFGLSVREQNMQDKRKILILQDKVQELEYEVEDNELYINNLRSILLRNKSVDSISRQMLSLNPSSNGVSSNNTLLFTPLKGIISSTFDPRINHYAIDIAAQRGEAVKAVENGTVIMADWTPDTGYVVMLQHNNNMLSVYKHNLTVYKRQGDEVKKGEVISAVGNTGELTTGPHLHFELWINGKPVDPQSYIVF